MLLLLLLISWLPNLIINQDTTKTNNNVKQRSIEFMNASELTLDKLDSLMLKFSKIDSLTNKH